MREKKDQEGEGESKRDRKGEEGIGAAKFVNFDWSKATQSLPSRTWAHRPPKALSNLPLKLLNELT